MLLDILGIVGGLALLFLGGDLLVRGSVRLATRFGVSPLFVGLVLVGFGTSAPELFASIEAVRVGAPAIAWGNVIGSNIANTLLVLGAAAIIAEFPVERGPLWRDGGFGLVAAIILFGFAFSGMPGYAGALLLAVLAVYLVFAWRQEKARTYRTASGDRVEMGEVVDPVMDVEGGGNPLIDTLLTVGGLALIIVGGNILVSGARDIALLLGLSETLVGLTIVAIGTSAPELATSVVAARKGEGGLAFGNVLGSNIYNILAIGGVTAVLAPGSLPREMIAVELPLLIAAAAVMMVFARTGHKFSRWEGAVMLLAYGGYLVWAVMTV
ncbi:MAG: calcium/sodium antiporter [Pacificimonas sp.]